MEDVVTVVQGLDDIVHQKTLEEESKRQSGPKRLKTDWVQKLESLLKCRSKSNYERLSSLGDGTYSQVYHVKDKGMT